MFFVKSSTSKRSWYSLQSFFNYNDKIKCEDTIFLSYQCVGLSLSKADPPPPPGTVVRCALNF